MIKSLWVGLILLLANVAHAQIKLSFTTDPDKFVKELDVYMRASRMENLITATDEFEATIKSGAIGATQMQQVITTSNIMIGRTMAPFPYFYNYISTITAWAKAKGNPQQLADWSAVCNDVAQNAKKGDNHDYGKFLEFSVALFRQGALFNNQSKVWKSDAKDYKLTYENGKAIVRYATCTLTGSTTTDTLIIKNTSGYFVPSENKWYGRGGHVDWSRNKLNPATVYANFKSPYAIAMETFSYSVDTVEFYFKDFFNYPLYGKFTDKFVASGNDSAASYPRFESKGLNITLKDVVPNVTYRGGFGLWGPKVIGVGTADSLAELTFYKKDKTRAITALSQNFTIKKNEEVGSPKAQIFIFNGNDTIFHPELTITYKARNNEVRMLRGSAGVSKSKFFDSYHNHEFDVDAIFWNLDSTRMQLRTLSGVGQTGSNFESNNYFNKDRLRKIQGVSSYDPLSKIKKLYEKTSSRELNGADLAKAIDPHLTEDEAKSLYYELAEMGFIRYDEATGVVTMREKVINYVMANSKKVDYDIIHLKSVPKDGVDYMDLKNNNVELRGVSVIPISDTAAVVAFPTNKFVKLQKDRNMEFDGLIYGGRLDFFGKDHKFQYKPFTIGLNGLDSMRINIPDSGKFDQYNQPKMVTVKTFIEGVKGLLEVDAPINKSGRSRLMQFPKLTSKDKSLATYENPDIGKGAYKRKDFFFELEPFKLDSLNAFTPSVINWDGKLVSAGILPDIRNKLHIMPDLSLGFDYAIPAGGLKLYSDGSNNYEGDLKLNYTGLSGKGKVKHYTASFTSQDIMFFPDSMHSQADSFHIAKTAEGVRTPEVSNGAVSIYWKPKQDTMIIKMKEKSFSMYEGLTSLKGDLLLTGKGLRGGGFLDWKEATLSSKDFQFKTDDMAADTAAMNIKSISGDKVTFKTPNVNAKIDFKNRIGDFKSNLPNVPTDFAYNQFKTNIKEFKWYIDQKILDFKAPPEGQGEYFTSTRPSQLGLQFLGRRATYNLETSVLRVEQVPYIYVADAKVVPDSGVVVVLGEAKIKPLTNATIYVDTASLRHKIEKCNVDIISKAELRADGLYKYSCRDHKDQLMRFPDIKCTKEAIDLKHSKVYDEWSLVAKGNIEDKDKFYLHPWVTYKGEAFIWGRNTNLFFNGFAKLKMKNAAAPTIDFSITEDVDPDHFLLHYDTLTKSTDSSKVATGIFFSKESENATMYHTVFNVLQNAHDPALFRATGAVTYNEKTGEYWMGDDDKIVKGSKVGTLMKYNDDKGYIKAEGPMTLGANFGLIRHQAVGTAEVDFAKNQYLFNLTFGLDMRTDNKNIEEKIQTLMYTDDIDLPDAVYDNDKFKMVFANITNTATDDKIIMEFEATNVFKRPRGFTYNWVFTDVNFIYDPTDMTLRSYGKIGLSFIGEKAIHKRLEGFIEIQMKTDNYNIYLKTGANEWFFFEYKPGLLGLVASYDDVNRLVGAVSADKRKVTVDKGSFYMYNIGSSINKDAFLDAMREKSNPNLPQEKIVIKPKLSAKDSLTRDSLKRNMESLKKIVSPAKDTLAKDTSVKTEEPKESLKSARQRRADKLREKIEEEKKDSSQVPPVPVVKDTVVKTIAPPPVVKDTVVKTIAPPPVVKDTVVKTIAPPPVVKDTVVKTIAPPPVVKDTVVKTIAPPPVVKDTVVKTIAPPPVVKDTVVKTIAPPPVVKDTVVKTIAPPPVVKDTVVKTIAPPPVVKDTVVKTIAPPPIVKDTVAKTIAPPPIVKDTVVKTIAPIVPVTPKDSATKVTPPPVISTPNDTINKR